MRTLRIRLGPAKSRETAPDLRQPQMQKPILAGPQRPGQRPQDPERKGRQDMTQTRQRAEPPLSEILVLFLMIIWYFLLIAYKILKIIVHTLLTVTVMGLRKAAGIKDNSYNSWAWLRQPRPRPATVKQEPLQGPWHPVTQNGNIWAEPEQLETRTPQPRPDPRPLYRPRYPRGGDRPQPQTPPTQAEQGDRPGPGPESP